MNARFFGSPRASRAVTWRRLAGMGLLLGAIASSSLAYAQEATQAVPASCGKGDQVCVEAIVTPAVSSLRVNTENVSRADTKFQFTTGAFITAAGSDIAISMYQIGRGNAREVGFGRWWQKDPVTLAVTKSAMIALFAFELQQVHKHNPKLAFVLGIAATALESAIAVRSAHMHAQVVNGPPVF